MRCTEGVKAVIIDAYNSENIGKIVTVVRAQTMRERLKIRHHTKVWMVRSSDKLKWNMNGTYHYDHFGPVPENQLQPIRDQAFHDWSEMNPQPRVNCFTYEMMASEQRSDKRRAELDDPTKCEC